MTPEQIERVFGRGRLKMVTGEHVEVFREAVALGERRRYTKRFLNTQEGDFGQWTEREWRILALLIGHGITCVPDVVQFDRGRVGGMQLVQTYDAGVTVDQWATLLPVMRNGRLHRDVFEDCAHWWALAHHCLLALNEIHRLELVHLDIKGDNVCIPYAPANFDPGSPDLTLRPVFAQFALIDFAFALVSRESLTTPLPIGWQKEYDYQSPRLLAALETARSGDLQPTKELDWRCDMYSLAAMLKRYLPDEPPELHPERAAGWTPERYDAAKALILRIRDSHDAELPAQRPHAELIEATGIKLTEPELASSLERGWTLARESSVSSAPASPLTPVTRVVPLTQLASPIHVTRSGRVTAVTVVPHMNEPQAAQGAALPMSTPSARPPQQASRARWVGALLAIVAFVAVAAALWYPGDWPGASKDELQALLAPVRNAADQAADAVTRLIPPDKSATAAASGQAPAARAAASENSGTTQRVPAQETKPKPPRATAAADAAPSPPLRESSAASLPQVSVATVPSAPPVSSAPSPSAPASHGRAADAQGGSLAQQRMQARAPAAATSQAPAATASQVPAKQAGNAGAAKSRTPSVAASTAPRASQSRSSTQGQRSHPWWATLEPPAWVTSRGRPPREPPALKAQEPDARLAASSTEALPGKPASAESVAPSGELALQSALPAGSAAAPSAVDAPRAQPHTRTTSTMASQAPVAAASDEKRVPLTASPGATWFGARSASPVEDRSNTLALPGVPAAVQSPSHAAPVEQSPPDEFGAQARRMLVDTVPRIARQAEVEIARVLLMAASAYRPAQDRAVADAARTARIRDDALQLARTTAPREARRFQEQARAALASSRNVPEALELQLKAFGANPRDPEVAGNLAALYLKLTPPRADMARQVSLMALAARASQYPATRLEDWYTFAAASALSGRESDARNAMYVALTLSPTVGRTCVAAWDVVANYGERLRGPAEAMLYRVHTQGRSFESPWCAWPPDWSTPPRLAGFGYAAPWISTSTAR